VAKGGAKVLQDDELEEFSYDDLVDMLNDAGELMIKKKAKLKDLELRYGSLQASYEELKTSHENLKETHEKLAEAHNTLLDHKDKAKLSMEASSETCKSYCVSSSTNPSCGTSDMSSCDESLVLENKKLKKEVTYLTNDLSKCYDSRAKFNHYWSSQKFTLNRQGHGYIPKKGKKAFYATKTVFVKKDGRPYCEKCKKMGHNEKNCTNNKVISFDSSYVLMKDSKGCVSAKYVGLPIYGAKKNAIWVSKTLVINIQVPKKIWYLKELLLFCR